MVKDNQSKNTLEISTNLLKEELLDDINTFLPMEIAFTKQLIKRNPVFENQGKEYIAQCLSLILMTKEKIRHL